MSKKLYESISNIINVQENKNSGSSTKLKTISSTHFKDWKITKNSDSGIVMQKYIKGPMSRNFYAVCALGYTESNDEVDAYISIEFKPGPNISDKISVRNQSSFKYNDHKKSMKKFLDNVKAEFNKEISTEQTKLEQQIANYNELKKQIG